MRLTKQAKMKVYYADIKTCEQRARIGEIAPEHVLCFANLLSATRAVQLATGPGYSSLDAIMDAVPAAYSVNWLKGRLARLRSERA